ncbi:hypothetical protein LTR56_007080 [Elasticomyces elasticus]|nr:hypothetical protein LTR56_007080 [Elasticomyces elasticus]
MRYTVVLMTVAYFTGATLAAPTAFTAPTDLSPRGARSDALPGLQGSEGPKVRRWINDDVMKDGSVDRQVKRHAGKSSDVINDPDFINGWDLDAVGTPDETS